MSQSDTPFRVTAEQLLPHGRLAAVQLPAASSEATLHDALAQGANALLAAERELAQALAVPRRISFIGGRVALRAALSSVLPATRELPVLRTARGAPLLPPGILGSVSHKRRLAVALAALPTSDAQTLGIDIEETPDERDLARSDLAPKILTPFERRELVELEARDALAYREAVRLRFALKEAVYKCIDPHVQRYVRFQEVEVFPDSAGSTDVRLSLPEFAGRSIVVRAWWSRLDTHLIATAVCSPLV
jgi:phosphopantetheine--protein transferase-like protein